MITKRIDWNNLYKVRWHNRSETMKHFLVKAMVLKILAGHNYIVYTEHRTMQSNSKKGLTRVADVYARPKQTKKENEIIIVEIESKPTKKHVNDLIKFYEKNTLIIVDLKRISMDIREMENQIREILPL